MGKTERARLRMQAKTKKAQLDALRADQNKDTADGEVPQRSTLQSCLLSARDFPLCCILRLTGTGMPGTLWLVGACSQLDQEFHQQTLSASASRCTYAYCSVDLNCLLLTQSQECKLRRSSCHAVRPACTCQ